MTRIQLRNKNIVIASLMFLNILFIQNNLLRIIINLFLVTVMIVIDIKFNPYLSLRQIKMYKILLGVFGGVGVINIVLMLTGIDLPMFFGLGTLALMFVIILMFREQSQNR